MCPLPDPDLLSGSFEKIAPLRQDKNNKTVNAGTESLKAKMVGTDRWAVRFEPQADLSLREKSG